MCVGGCLCTFELTLGRWICRSSFQSGK